MYDAIFIEGKGKPAVPFVYKYFNNDARSAASSKGMPNLRITLENIVSESTVQEDIEAEIGAVLTEMVANLTQPLTAAENSPQQVQTDNPARVVFKGSLPEVNQFYYRRGWTDGLPIFPPTEEAVAEMLTGTDLPRDQNVATLVPRRGKATVEKIAINAVMAGALPTYMPLLIAGVKCLLNNRVADMMAASTGSWAPFWIVNGPVRKDINLNASYGALNPGDMANITIGRALGLITKNIRGIRKGIEDMGVLGNPGKFSMVAAENEEDSPWEPLHCERGLKRADSAITLTFPQCYDQIYPYGTDDAGLLKSMIYNLTPSRIGITGFILTPTNAASLAKKGWTKKTIKEWVIQNAKMPYDHDAHFYGNVFDVAEKKPGVKATDLVPIIVPTPRSPDPVQIYVLGGMGSWVGIASGGGDIRTEKVDLPANWDKLVKKYRDLVPQYYRY